MARKATGQAAVTALGLLALLCVATMQTADARMVPHRQVAKRAAMAGGQAVGLHARQMAPAGPSAANPAAPPSSTGNPLIGGVSDVLNGLTSSTVQQSSNTAAPVPSSASAPLSSSTLLSSSVLSSSALSSSSAVPSSSAAESASRPQASVVNVTSVQIVEASAEASAAAQSAKPEESSSGIGKKTIIIIAAIASSVGLVAAIWTIFRKIKFSPSRRFEDKLNPINWSPTTGSGLRGEDMTRNGSQLGLTRSHSGSSGGHDSINPAGVKRTGSWGSHAGSAVGSLRRGDGGMSEVRSNYTAAVPAYPPSYPASDVGGHNRFNSYGSVDRQPGYQPYEQVSRQPTVNIGGGRFGEGYGGSIRR